MKLKIEKLFDYKKNLVIFFILIGLIFSVSNSYNINKNYNKNFFEIGNKNAKGENGIIGHKDIFHFWNEAKEVSSSLMNKKPYHLSYDRMFLHPRIIGFYLYFFDILEKKVNYIKNNEKFIFFVFQSLFYYLALFIFFSSNLIIEKNIKYFSVIFLAIEPTIMQYHSSFYSESIFISLFVILISIIISSNLNIKKFFLAGCLCGILYLQRTIALLLPLILLTLFIYFKKLNFNKFFFFVLPFLVIVGSLLINNKTRTGEYFITPIQSLRALPYYLAPTILKNHNKNNENTENFLKKKYNIKDLRDETEIKKRNYFKKINTAAREELLKYPYELVLNFVQNLPRTLALNYYQVKNDMVYNQGAFSREYYKNQKIFRGIYSIVIYLLTLIGLFSFVKEKKYFLSFLLFSIIGYFIFFSNLFYPSNRYAVPSLICVSVFFSKGFFFIKKNIKKSIFKN